MKMPVPQDSSTKVWLSIMAGVAVIFLITTAYSLFHILRSPQQAEEAAPETGSVVATAAKSNDADPAPQTWATSAMLTHGKPLPMPAAPVHPEQQSAPHLYLTPDEARQRAIHAQAEYLREVSKKYPNSPLSLTPQEISEMEKQGLTAW